MGRMAAAVQRHLGGVVYVPSSGAAYADAHAFEHSWPPDHPAHGHD
jgi:hypothetical protein